MRQIAPVINMSGDHEETILQLAKHLGTDKVRRKVFSILNGRASKPRSLKQIMATEKFSDQQQVRNALAHLAQHDLIAKISNDGSADDRSRYLYSKFSFVAANKKKIIRYADDKKAAAKVPTKRRNVVAVNVSLNSISQKVLRKKKPLNVLYLTADPTQKGSLRLDYEVSGVQDEIRGSRFRENINILTRPAATMKSLLNGLNDHHPQIVHFSGHGNQMGILAENGSVEQPSGKIISFETLSRALGATDHAPDVIVLNSCKSAGAKRLFLPPGKVAIVMRDSVSDVAASAFATFFYAAIAGGQSVKSAFEQGNVALESVSLGERHTPELLCAEGTSPEKLVLT